MRSVALIAAPQTQILDVTGPAEVFSRATHILCERGLDHSGYTISLASTDPNRRVSTSAGIHLEAHAHYSELPDSLDTLLIAGGRGATKKDLDPGLIEWLQERAPSIRRVGSVCTGSFVLAAAGLLAGKRATTHWQWTKELAARYPDILVDPEPIFIQDGIYTSAGVTAGIDLSLALVEEDFGPETAVQVARELVVFLRRPGGQSQFSAAMSLAASARQSIRDLQTWILAHLENPLSVDALAREAAMSPRNFARIFLEETGITPAKFVQRARVEEARRRLEQTNDGLDQVAAASGFGSVDSLSRAFQQELHVTPGDYRKHFWTSVSPNLKNWQGKRTHEQFNDSIETAHLASSGS